MTDVLNQLHFWVKFSCITFCSDTCKAKGRLADVEGTDVYCHRNCLRYPSTCPKDECECFSEEEVANELANEGIKVDTFGDEVWKAFISVYGSANYKLELL